jgi:hypothetical protein
MSRARGLGPWNNEPGSLIFYLYYLLILISRLPLNPSHQVCTIRSTSNVDHVIYRTRSFSCFALLVSRPPPPLLHARLHLRLLTLCCTPPGSWRMLPTTHPWCALSDFTPPLGLRAASSLTPTSPPRTTATTELHGSPLLPRPTMGSPPDGSCLSQPHHRHRPSLEAREGACKQKANPQHSGGCVVELMVAHCHTWFLWKNQVLIVCMTQDQLFHTYRPKVFTDNQMSRIKYNYYIIIISKDWWLSSETKQRKTP